MQKDLADADDTNNRLERDIKETEAHKDNLQIELALAVQAKESIEKSKRDSIALLNT